MLEPVKLSLANFQPDKCYPPYLSTPRSLEACRLNGVNPLELVEIPFSEFQKDFPNDMDAARRRFERIDGARRLVLAAVLEDWKDLCNNNWKPPADNKRKVNKETIVAVHAAAHCKLLEIQAAKFRKIELDNWEALQRNLKLEIMHADEEVRHKAILEKHEEIQEKNDSAQNERRIRLQELYREELMCRQREEEEKMQELKLEQTLFGDQCVKKGYEDKELQRREKTLREQKERERVQREKYTQQVKDSIEMGIERKIENRKKISEIRAKNNEDRIKEFESRKAKEREERKNNLHKKIDQVRDERMRFSEETTKTVLEKIAEHERHRQYVEEMREKQKTELQPLKDDESFEKLLKIKEKNDNSLKEKADRTLSQIQYKEDLAKRELEKVKEAQDRRRNFKAIRQEAHEIALQRAQKAEEYRREKVLQQLQFKEERSNAIKEGFQMLSQMRTSMKDIMVKTNLELKCEMDRLRHIDNFSPDKVVQKALEVSNQVLFPSLERRFGIEDHNQVEPVKKFFSNTGEGFSFDLGINKDATDTAPLYAGDKTGEMMAEGATTTNAGHKTQRPSTVPNKTAVSMQSLSSNPPNGGRLDKAPLPINAVTQDALRNSLVASMKKVELMNNADDKKSKKSFGTSLSPQNAGQYSARGGNADDSVPVPILKLQDDETGGWIDDMGSSVTGERGLSNKPHTSSSNRHNKPKPSNQQISDSMNKTAHSRKSRKNDHDENDPKLPIFPFTAGQEYENSPSPGGTNGIRTPHTGSSRRSKGSDYFKEKKEKLRTDVNEKAKYLPVPAGRFRREFSIDHPLAPGGKGEYKEELAKGLKPTGLFIPPEKRDDTAADVENTIKLSQKVEKLTYSAQISSVDPDGSQEKFMDDLKKELNKKLETVLMEEQEAEDDRMEVLLNVHDQVERANLEAIFSNERQRASDRIISITKENEGIIKKALLQSMNLNAQ